MKLLSLLIYLFFFSLSIQSYGAKAPIVKLEAVFSGDLYTQDFLKIRLKAKREDGQRLFSNGSGKSNLAWRKVYIKSKQGVHTSNGLFKVRRASMLGNDNSVTIYVKIFEGRNVFEDSFQYHLPRILDVTLSRTSIAPYTHYEKVVLVKTMQRNYFVGPQTDYRGLQLSDFEIEFSNGVLSTPDKYIYKPTGIHVVEELGYTIKNTKCDWYGRRSLSLQELTRLTRVYKGERGERGYSGSDGVNGDDGACGQVGEDGQDGEDGGDGEVGGSGWPVELLIRANTSEKMEVIIFVNGGKEHFFVNRNCKISISSIGGEGGPGGFGGSGGRGGDGSDVDSNGIKTDDNSDGTCGADGSDGNGGDGGVGGTIKVYSSLKLHELASILELIVDGGPGGSNWASQGQPGGQEYFILSNAEMDAMFTQLHTQ